MSRRAITAGSKGRSSISARNRQFRQARKGSGKQYRPGVLREDVTRARDELQAELTGFESDANADLAALLREELRACADTYEQAKAKAGALDFLDLLLKARNLVRDDAEVRRSFQQRFKRLFVDEFQDTDPLQAEILLLLAADDPSVTDWKKVRPVPGKLFIVGDPKQSIYRFRRADVGIYRDVYEMLQAAGAKPVTLRTSFRARPNIQRTINAAFAPVMTRRCAGCAGQLRPARAVPIRFAGAAIGHCASCPRAVRQTADCEHVNRGVASGCRRRVRALADSRQQLEGVDRASGQVEKQELGADPGPAHLPAVSPLRQLRRGHDAAVRAGARSARHPASARRRPVVSQSRRNRDAARRARGDRVARR